MSTRQVKKTEAGKEFQIELLSGETKRLKKNIEKQIRLLENLRSTANTGKVKHELEKLSNTFAELSSVSERLSAILSKDDAKELRRLVGIEGEKVGKIEESMNEWLRWKKSSLSGGSRKKANSLVTLGNLEGTMEAEDNVGIQNSNLQHSRMHKEREMLSGCGRTSIRSEPVSRPKPPKMGSCGYLEGEQLDSDR